MNLCTKKYWKANHPENEKKGCLFAVAAAVLILGVLLFDIYKTMVPTDYRIFTEERINTLERKYNMELSGVEPERYWVPALAQDIQDRFRFRVDGYHKFMENNYFGTVISCYESDDLSYAEYICKPYDDNDLEFSVTFQKNGEKYDADLVSY